MTPEQGNGGRHEVPVGRPEADIAHLGVWVQIREYIEIFDRKFVSRVSVD